MTEGPEILRSNEFWGRRAGARIVEGNKESFVFRIKRGGGVSTGNSGPSGHKLRWYVERAWRKGGGKNWAKKRFGTKAYQAVRETKKAA